MSATTQHPKVMKPIVSFTKPTKLKTGYIPLDIDAGRRWRHKPHPYDQRNQARSDRKRRKLNGSEPEKIGSRRYRRYIGTV